MTLHVGGDGDQFRSLSTTQDGSAPAPRAGAELRIVSGSENEGLEPLINEFGRRAGIDVEMSDQGSVDISLELQKGTGSDYDAVWPANSVWIDLDRAEFYQAPRLEVPRLYRRYCEAMDAVESPSVAVKKLE